MGHRLTVVVVVAASLVSLGVAGAGARSRPASSVGGEPAGGLSVVRPSDFDGDGYADLAIGAPYDAVGGRAGAGVVHVLYGGPPGLGSAGDQVWHQDRAGIPNAAEAGDHFGWALAAGDFDNDGYGDLAIGIPGEDIVVPDDAAAADLEGPDFGPAGVTPGPAPDAGAVQFLFGGENGLSATGEVLFAPRSDAPGQTDAQLGYALASGDFFTGSPGHADIAIGLPGFYAARGAVRVLPGECVHDDPPVGCPFELLQFIELDPGARAGHALAAGDFLDGPDDDLAVGAPYADTDASGGLPAVGDAGFVLIANYSGGVDAYLHQGGFLPQTREAGDHLGWALAAGDVNDDGRKDLLVGVPDEDLGGKSNAGLVEVVLPPVGVGEIGFTLVDQDFPGVPGSRAAHARFGAALAVANFGKGGYRDVAVGIPGWDRPGDAKAGAVAVIYGTSDGPAASGNQLWHQDSSGIADTAEVDDGFGSRLFAADFGKTGAADLAIGVPREDIGGHSNAGVVQVLYGSSTGLTAVGDQLWHQDVVGIGESAASGDRFGQGLP